MNRVLSFSEFQQIVDAGMIPPGFQPNLNNQQAIPSIKSDGVAIVVEDDEDEIGRSKDVSSFTTRPQPISLNQTPSSTVMPLAPPPTFSVPSIPPSINNTSTGFFAQSQKKVFPPPPNLTVPPPNVMQTSHNVSTGKFPPPPFRNSSVSNMNTNTPESYNVLPNSKNIDGMHYNPYRETRDSQTALPDRTVFKPSGLERSDNWSGGVPIPPGRNPSGPSSSFNKEMYGSVSETRSNAVVPFPTVAYDQGGKRNDRNIDVPDSQLGVRGTSDYQRRSDILAPRNSADPRREEPGYFLPPGRNSDNYQGATVSHSHPDAHSFGSGSREWSVDTGVDLSGKRNRLEASFSGKQENRDNSMGLQGHHGNQRFVGNEAFGKGNYERPASSRNESFNHLGPEFIDQRHNDGSRFRGEESFGPRKRDVPPLIGQETFVQRIQEGPSFSRREPFDQANRDGPRFPREEPFAAGNRDAPSITGKESLGQRNQGPSFSGREPFNQGNRDGPRFPREESFGAGNRDAPSFTGKESLGQSNQGPSFSGREPFNQGNRDGPRFPREESFGAGNRDAPSFSGKESLGQRNQGPSFSGREPFNQGSRDGPRFPREESFGAGNRYAPSFTGKESLGQRNQGPSFSEREPFNQGNRDGSRFSREESFGEGNRDAPSFLGKEPLIQRNQGGPSFSGREPFNQGIRDGPRFPREKSFGPGNRENALHQNREEVSALPAPLREASESRHRIDPNFHDNGDNFNKRNVEPPFSGKPVSEALGGAPRNSMNPANSVRKISETNRDRNQSRADGDRFIDSRYAPTKPTRDTFDQNVDGSGFRGKEKGGNLPGPLPSQSDAFERRRSNPDIPSNRSKVNPIGKGFSSNIDSKRNFERSIEPRRESWKSDNLSQKETIKASISSLPPNKVSGTNPAQKDLGRGNLKPAGQSAVVSNANQPNSSASKLNSSASVVPPFKRPEPPAKLANRPFNPPFNKSSPQVAPNKQRPQDASKTAVVPPFRPTLNSSPATPSSSAPDVAAAKGAGPSKSEGKEKEFDVQLKNEPERACSSVPEEPRVDRESKSLRVTEEPKVENKGLDKPSVPNDKESKEDDVPSKNVVKSTEQQPETESKTGSSNAVSTCEEEKPTVSDGVKRPPPFKPLSSSPAKHPAKCKQCDILFQSLTEAQSHWKSPEHVEKSKQVNTEKTVNADEKKDSVSPPFKSPVSQPLPKSSLPEERTLGKTSFPSALKRVSNEPKLVGEPAAKYPDLKVKDANLTDEAEGKGVVSNQNQGSRAVLMRPLSSQKPFPPLVKSQATNTPLQPVKALSPGLTLKKIVKETSEVQQAEPQKDEVASETVRVAAPAKPISKPKPPLEILKAEKVSEKPAAETNQLLSGSTNKVDKLTLEVTTSLNSKQDPEEIAQVVDAKPCEKTQETGSVASKPCEQKVEEDKRSEEKVGGAVVAKKMIKMPPIDTSMLKLRVSNDIEAVKKASAKAKFKCNDCSLAQADKAAFLEHLAGEGHFNKLKSRLQVSEYFQENKCKLCSGEEKTLQNKLQHLEVNH